MEIKRGPATRRDDAGSVAGELVLDGRRLRFETRAVGAGAARGAGQAGAAAIEVIDVIEVADIKRLERGWSKLFGVIPTAPNALTVVMRNETAHRFAVAGRKAWIETIEHARADTPRG